MKIVDAVGAGFQKLRCDVAQRTVQVGHVLHGDGPVAPHHQDALIGNGGWRRMASNQRRSRRRRPNTTSHQVHTMGTSACQGIPMDRLWVNPDYGLKTRRWDEVTPALQNTVEAAPATCTSQGTQALIG